MELKKFIVYVYKYIQVCVYPQGYTDPQISSTQICILGKSHLPQEVYNGAEVSWDDQGQSHSCGEHQGRSWCEAMHMNHGQQLGLESRVSRGSRGAPVGMSPTVCPT
jgi:hypothetical protein